jgi:hypothetical protein
MMGDGGWWPGFKIPSEGKAICEETDAVRRDFRRGVWGGREWESMVLG